MEKVLVTGAGGFIGGHLVTELKKRGHWVRGADIQSPVYRSIGCDEFYRVDLRNLCQCENVCNGMDWVFNLAADMGGIGYIGTVTALISINNIHISTNMLEAAKKSRVKKFFYSSSACVYPGYRQNNPDVVSLKEEDAYPFDPEPGYGWEKLFTEQLCKYYRNDYDLQTYVARFHNVYGPYGTYDGGKEKAPAALCRKISRLTDGSDLPIWGDGKQTRSFLYVSDCVNGILKLVDSNFHNPINIGSDRLVTVTDLADIICKIAGKKLNYVFDPSKPQGVRGRCSDNTLVKATLGWEPQVTLEEGLAKTYQWIDGLQHGK